MWANIGECGGTPAGAVVCAAFCGMRAWIQGQKSRYRSTVGETPGVPGARGEGGALGVRRGEVGLSWFEVVWARPGRGVRGSEAGAGRWASTSEGSTKRNGKFALSVFPCTRG